MLKWGVACAFLCTLLVLVSPAPATTDDAVDLRPYLPIDPYNGKAYRFVTLAKSGETSYWQTYKVSKEKGELILDFNEYDENFSLQAENRQRVAADGLRVVSRTIYFKGKGGKVESSSLKIDGQLVLPWSLKKGGSFTKAYSLRTYFDDTYGYITYDVKETLTLAGIQSVTVNGKQYECAVVDVDQRWTSALDSGYRYPESRATLKYYYGKGIGYIRWDVTQAEQGATVSELRQVVTLEEFEKLKAGKITRPPRALHKAPPCDKKA